MLKIRAFRKFLFVLLCLLYIGVYPRPQELYQMSIFQGGEVLFYCDTLPPFKVNWLDNGINYEIKTGFDDAHKVRQAISPLFQTVIIKGDLNNVLRYLKISVKDRAEINGGLLISGYSQIVKCRERNGINIQIYFKEGKIYAGSPAIEGTQNQLSFAMW